MPNINERSKKFGRKNPLKYFSILLKGTNITKKSEEKNSKLIKSLWFIFFIDVIKFNHMAVDWVRPNKQNNSFIKTFLNIFATHVVIKHQVGEYLNVKDHFFVI